MDKLRATLHYIIHILLAVIIILLILVRPAPSNTSTIVERPGANDTIWLDTTIFVKVPIPEPYEVTIIDTIRRTDTFNLIDTIREPIIANMYEDSIQQDHGTITWSALVHGRLLNLDAAYRGKIPRTVIEYRNRNILVPQRGLFLRSSIGYNGDQVSGTIGGEILTKKGRAFGYQYDYILKYHSITSAIKVF